MADFPAKSAAAQGSRIGQCLLSGLALTFIGMCGCASVQPSEAVAPRQQAVIRVSDQTAPRVVPQTSPVVPQRQASRAVQLVSASNETLKAPVADQIDVADVPERATDAASSQAEESQAIDLTTALLMTSGESPQIAFAQARIEEALAQRDRAEALWLPSIRAGINYNKHEGRIQDVAGTVIETSRGSFYTGLGANAVGAGSPAVPGLLASFHFADAVFQPRIAERTACARQSGAQVAMNDSLLQTALAYVTLLRAAQEWAIARDIEQQARELARVTGEYSRTGQGLQSDADRAQAELALRKTEILRAEEAVAVASARLGEQIHWTSGQSLMPAEPRLVPVELVAPETPRQELVALALVNRPEISESRHLVGEAVERLQRERYAPLVPSVLLGVSYGGLGGGLGSNLTNFGDRLDADAVAYWEIRNLGVGERAVRREAQSRIDQAHMREVMILDRIAREVLESQAQVAARQQQIDSAHAGVDAAQQSFDRNWVRIQAGQGLPIEVLQSLQTLAAARREYVRAVSDYNSAQFSLHRALGWPISTAPGTDGSTL